MTKWNNATFARNLKYYIDKQGKTQKEVAEAVGVSAPTMNDWLKGKKMPRMGKIELLADYFGILKSDLIEDKSAERDEMQKKNDTAVGIVKRLGEDAEFAELVKILYKLEPDKIASVKNLLLSFAK